MFGLFQHSAGIGADFIADVFHGCCLGSSVIFHRSADDTAGIGDEVGQVQHPLGMQILLCFRGQRDVGPLRNQLCFQAMDVVLVQDVGSGGRHPDVTVKVNHLFTLKLLTPWIVQHRASARLDPDQFLHINTVRIVDGCPGIGHPHQDNAFL